jgi:hypothetical protein
MAPDIKILKTVFSNLFFPLKILCLGSKTVKILILISNAPKGSNPIRIRNVAGAALFLS